MARADLLARPPREQRLEDGRRPLVAPSPAASRDRVLALVRAVGNRRAATLFAQSPMPTARVLHRKGRLSSSIETIGTKWDDFAAHSGDVEDILFNDFAPLLEEHTKAYGMTKNPLKAGQPGVTYDPDKPRATEVAAGLLAWLTSASEGAERYYAEMRSALVAEGAPSLNWQFGISDITEPDVHSLAGASLESKRTTSVHPAGVDTLIREARFQSTKRMTMPNSAPFTAWRIAIEIDADNPWPYTATELKKAGIAANQLPGAIVNSPASLPEPPQTRAARRNLVPQKGSKKAAVPAIQNGKHEVIINWLRHGLQWKGWL